MIALLPWLYLIAMISIFIGALCGVLIFIHPTQRTRYGKLLRVISVTLVASIWLRSFSLVYYTWGTLLAIIGVALGGLGIIPMAIVVFYKTGHQRNAFFLAAMFGVSLAAYLLARRVVQKGRYQ